jgi:hypothetical protein
MPFSKQNIHLLRSASTDPQYDPMAHFFAYTQHSPEQQQAPTGAPNLKHAKSNSLLGYRGPIQQTLASVRQQPSPDATDASPIVPGTAPCMDVTHNHDVSFSFDDLWSPSWNHPNGIMPMGQTVESAEAYSHYLLGPPPIAIGNVLITNANTPLYSAGDYR